MKARRKKPEPLPPPPPKPPIPERHVRIERVSYGYGQQGQTWITHQDECIVPDYEAIQRLSGQHVTVTWPDGGIESYDLAVQPCRAMTASMWTRKPGETNLGYIGKELCELSRLPNVAIGYYRPFAITAEQRKSFIPLAEWDAMQKATLT